MQNFIFHNPTKIVFGRNTISGIGSETATFGRRALLVYGGGSIKKNGVYEQAIKGLAEAGITVVEHPGVRSNPVLSHVREGIALAKAEKVDVVIAVGGGSVIDSAKAICAGAKVEHDVWQFFKGKKGVKAALPLTCVLTLAASGSEMNGGMVVTNEETEEKFGFASQLLLPRVSILDPTATFSVPRDYTAYGAVDAIAHILEFYFTTKDPCTAVQDRFMEGLIINIMESCDRVIVNLDDYEARADLMWCATLALNGLSGAGLGPVGFPMHLIEHSLSALYDVPHGAGLSVVILAWLTYNIDTKRSRLSQFAKRIFHSVQEDETTNAQMAIRRLRLWFERIKSPTTLAGLNIPKSDIGRIAENCQGLAKVWRMREYNKGVVEAILKLA